MRLKRVDVDILGALPMRTVRTDRGTRGVFYRIEAGPIADAAAADHACAALKERKVGCILVRP
ncbi:MAG: SPOR domain-containing protein [Stellaceae bacterium]